MTNDPRYSPRPIPPIHPGQYGPQQPYDWRYASQQRPPQQPPPHQQPQQQRPPQQFDPYRTGAPVPNPGIPLGPQKRSRAGALTAGALAIAVVSAGIGGGVALLADPGPAPAPRIGSSTGAAPSLPAANLPQGSVEQVAAKVVPSVVKLQTDLGRATEEGSGIILSADGLILTNNHVVAITGDGRGSGPGAPEGPRRPGGSGSADGKAATTVTFADGRTAPFTVVGADPASDIAVVKKLIGLFIDFY